MNTESKHGAKGHTYSTGCGNSKSILSLKRGLSGKEWGVFSEWAHTHTHTVFLISSPLDVSHYIANLHSMETSDL